jgi:hypothetical protein
MIVIYKNPSDCPDKYVARLWELGNPTMCVVIGDTLEAVRKPIPEQYVNIGRNPNDDPVIVEVWIG